MLKKRAHPSAIIKALIICSCIGLFLLTGIIYEASASSFNRALPHATQKKEQAAASNDQSSAAAVLQHAATGTAVLYYDADDKQLTVVLTMEGLAPKSIHPAHIHAGSCDTPSTPANVVYPLNNLLSDAQGYAYDVTHIANVPDGIPAYQWYINVHNGPGMMANDQAMSISCGNVRNPHHDPAVEVQMGVSPITLSEHASGLVTMKLVSSDQLAVSIVVRDLAPNSSHAAHIHKGTCEDPGDMLYDFGGIKANAHGVATKTLMLKINTIRAIPRNAWIVNVHLSTDLSTQTGFSPILCGDVVPNNP